MAKIGESAKKRSARVLQLPLESELHQLSGKLKKFWAIKVNGNYRVWFRFENEDAYDAQYGDYH